MYRKYDGNPAEIRSYIKNRSNLGISAKLIFNEIQTLYGDQAVSYRTVARWNKKFREGVESLENNPRTGRKISKTTIAAEAKIQNLINTDARYTVRELAKATGISLSKVHFILKKRLHARKISARWIPHLLSDDQKRARVTYAKEMLKLYPKFDKKRFANVVTGDETWVHFYEPQRKVRNKIWATKSAKRLCIARRTMSVKKVMYAVFFSTQGPAIQIPVPKGKGVTGKFYRDKVLKKLKRYYSKRRPKCGFQNIRLLHDNAPAHKARIVTEYLQQEKVTVLPHPPYSPDLAPCDYFLFPRLKKMLAGRKFSRRCFVGSAVFQCLKGIPTKDYENAFRMWIKRLKLCIEYRGEYFEGMK